MLGDRIRMMGNHVSYRPHQKIERVYVKNSSNSWDSTYGYINIKPFKVDVSTLTYYEKHMYPSRYTNNQQSCILLYDSTRANNETVLLGSYHALSDSYDVILAIQSRIENPFSRYFFYKYYLSGRVGEIEEVTLTFNQQNNPGIITSSSYSGTYASSGATQYNAWKIKFNDVPIKKIAYQAGIRNDGDSAYIYEMKLTNGGKTVVDLIPVKFLDTNQYGLLDLVSGNYIDKTSFSGGTVSFNYG